MARTHASVSLTAAQVAALLGNLDVTVSSRATPAQVLTQVQAEIGVASGSTLLSIFGILGDPATSFTAQIARLLNTEFVAPYSSGVQLDDIALVGPTLTTAVSITPTFPVGATKVRVIAVVDLFIMNDSANAQKITPILQVQLNGAGYNNRWTPGGTIVAVPATDGTSASIRAVVTITADVVTLQQTDFKWSITQTSANSVHYTSQATIFLVYTV